MNMPKSKHTTTVRDEVLIALMLSVLATLALLVASPDSYLHDLYDHVDSAWYYLCGKAWANGLTPYVDFTDSKGPLLWLIYGLAYAMSPTDYTGVFWLTCLNFGVTLYIIYRCAWLLLGDRRLAVLAAVFMIMAYLYPAIHFEVKTEDFAQPYVALCLYGTLRLWLNQGRQSGRGMWWLMVMGVCMGCVAMIKYSFVPMLAIFALLSLVALYRSRQGVWRGVLFLLAGMLLALLPWVCYFVATGTFKPFVQEYVGNTLATVSQLHQDLGSWKDLLLKLRLKKIVTLFPVLCFGGALLHAALLRRTRWVALVCTLWFFLLTIPNAWWIYYYVICSWTMFFGITALLHWVQGRPWHISRVAAAVISLVVVALTGTLSVWYYPSGFFTSKAPARETYYRYAYLMSQVPNPKVIYWDCYATGFETPAHGLPACKYWAGQNGATPAMRQAQEQAVRDGVADFVLVMDTVHDARLAAWGYHKWDYSRRDSVVPCDDVLFTLFTRHRLQPPPPTFTPPSAAMIVTKSWRNGR